MYISVINKSIVVSRILFYAYGSYCNGCSVKAFEPFLVETEIVSLSSTFKQEYVLTVIYSLDVICILFRVLPPFFFFFFFFFDFLTWTCYVFCIRIPVSTGCAHAYSWTYHCTWT